jgi:hypothetical protein
MLKKFPLYIWTLVALALTTCGVALTWLSVRLGIPTAILTLRGSSTSTPSPAADTPTAEIQSPSGLSATFFPLGFMGPADEELFSQVAAGGFNVVYEFRSIQEIPEAEDYLNRAEAAGLNVIQNMPVCRVYETAYPICEEHNVAIWSEEEWAEFISTLSTHENLVAWFLPDEIDNYSAAADLYRQVKAYDPYKRPVYGNPGTFEFSKISRFPALSDYLWAACYPEYYEQPRAIVTYGMKLDSTACQGTNDRWGAILQYFDSSEYGRTGGHPTAFELRADSYQAIIGGANGLWYFNFEMGQELDDGVWEELTSIADEIIGSGGLDKVILSPDVPTTITRIVLSGPAQSLSVEGEVYDSIQILQKEYQGTYLLAVNIGTDVVEVEFCGLPDETTAVEVLFEDRTIPAAGGTFRDVFAQDEVHIYRVLADVSDDPVLERSQASGGGND